MHILRSLPFWSFMNLFATPNSILYYWSTFSRPFPQDFPFGKEIYFAFMRSNLPIFFFVSFYVHLDLLNCLTPILCSIFRPFSMRCKININKLNWTKKLLRIVTTSFRRLFLVSFVSCMWSQFYLLFVPGNIIFIINFIGFSLQRLQT